MREHSLQVSMARGSNFIMKKHGSVKVKKTLIICSGSLVSGRPPQVCAYEKRPLRICVSICLSLCRHLGHVTCNQSRKRQVVWARGMEYVRFQTQRGFADAVVRDLRS